MKTRQKVCLYAVSIKRQERSQIVRSILYSCLFFVVSCACVAQRWAVEGSRKCMNHEGMCLCWIEPILTSQRENTHHGPVLSPALHLQSFLLVLFYFQKRKHSELSLVLQTTSRQNIKIIELCSKQNMLHKVKLSYI